MQNIHFINDNGSFVFVSAAGSIYTPPYYFNFIDAHIFK